MLWYNFRVGTMSEIRAGAETVTTTAAEITAEIPVYREMAEVITATFVIIAGFIAATCVVIIARNITQMGKQ